MSKPSWDKAVSGTPPALADLNITSEEMEQARLNNERIQSELVEARGAIGGGLGNDLEFIDQQVRLSESYAAQLAHWEDESLKVETKTWTCPVGHHGDEWQALEPATVDTAEGRVESKHGDPACPQCGSTELTWVETQNRPTQIELNRKGLATALYRLSRFDEAMEYADGELAERIHAVAEAVHKPDDQKCGCGVDYTETDRLLSTTHGNVLSVLSCPVCHTSNATPLIEAFQPLR